MKKRLVTIIGMAAVLGMVGVAGCGTKNSTGNETALQKDATDTNSAKEENNSAKTSESSKTAENTSDIDGQADTKNVAENAIFEELSKYSFTFESGAGAWSTELSVKKDGSFSGMYHDSDMGDTGKNYENGTIYTCKFSGKFASVQKVNDYTYKTSIKEISTEQENGKEEILDGTRYVYSTPYGLDDAKDIYIYVKGATVSNLPEGYLSWVNDAINGSKTLPFYGIYNENAETGFSGWTDSEQSDKGSSDASSGSSDKQEVSDAIAEEISDVEEKASELEVELEDALLSASEQKNVSKELYTLWDDELNSVWKQLKKTLDSDTMSTLTKKEKTWIKDKESQVEEAGKSYEDSNKKEAAQNQKGAELTKARVYELIEYLK